MYKKGRICSAKGNMVRGLLLRVAHHCARQTCMHISVSAVASVSDTSVHSVYSVYSVSDVTSVLLGQVVVPPASGFACNDGCSTSITRSGCSFARRDVNGGRMAGEVFFFF